MHRTSLCSIAPLTNLPAMWGGYLQLVLYDNPLAAPGNEMIVADLGALGSELDLQGPDPISCNPHSCDPIPP